MSFDAEYDVIVAGTGAAGGGAVMGALLNGANNILVCEKSNDGCGGTTQNAGLGWMWVPNNRFLKEMGIKQDPKELVELLKVLAENSEEGHKVDEGDYKLMKAFAYEWPDCMAKIEENGFLKLKTELVRSDEDAAKLLALYEEKMKQNPKVFEKMGITKAKLDKLKHFMPSYCGENDLDNCPTGKVVSCEGKGTSGYIQQVIKSNADKVTLKEGVQIIDLIFSDSDKTKVIGVVALEVETKKKLRFKANNGVIFGTGGFSFNKEMMKKYFDCEFHGTCAGEKNTGDFIDISIRHGINVYGMNEAWVKQVVVPENQERFPGVFFHNADSYIVVNKYGKRFANERDYYQERGRRMIKNQKDLKLVFAIYDARSEDLHAGPIMSLGGPIPFPFAKEDCTLTGNTFEELSANIQAHLEKHNCDFQLDSTFAQQLKDQVARFNKFAANGKDEEFHRGDTPSKHAWQTPRRDNVHPNKCLHPIDTSNLRALVLGLSTLDTRGGPRTTEDGQIYKSYEKKEIIQGLYGAGNCVKSFAKHSYPASGVTIAAAMFFGHQAAKHAMQPKNKL